MSRPKPSGRSYGRLTRHERNTVERMLDRNRSAREIAAELGRSPSTVTREVAAHRYVTAPRSRYGEPAPADLSGACPRLSTWPRCCNGCSHRRGYGCSRRPRVFFDRLTAADCALLMSQVNSEPRGALGFLTPARVLRMALGEDASALMDAFGIEELAPGKLDLTPGCIERARAARGEGPLAG